MPRTRLAANSSRHTRMMIGLGFKGGARNHATYLRKLTYSKAWNKAHHAAGIKASHKYYIKIQAEMGNQGLLSKSLYPMKYAAIKLQKRKDRANEARKELLRLQRLLPNRRGGRSSGPLTCNN
ncbi:hypothetical protein LCGC14_3056040 [marine sediment metagenome]|uniref:Uncharacterized protein n=1 Tax=marine sediment metagenome TaxID=412755 RepID=A0A0F8ZB30_9ZZZZ